MANAKSDTTPYWSTSTTFPQFAKLAENAEAEVVVVGGGITGDRCICSRGMANASSVSNAADAGDGHRAYQRALTMVTDTRLSELLKRLDARTRRQCGRRVSPPSQGRASFGARHRAVSIG